MILSLKITKGLRLFSVVILGSLFVVAGCTSPATTSPITPENINQTSAIYQSLSITPQPNNQLCWYDANFFVDRWDDFIANPSFEGGLIHKLTPHDGKLIGQETYQVPINTTIHLTYKGYFYDKVANTMPVRYIALLNEQQLATAFDNVDTLYHDILFQNHQTETFDMTIPPLEESIYELVIIGIQQAELFDDGHAGVFAIRITLIVGNPPLFVDREAYDIIPPTEQRNNQNADIYWSLTLHGDQTHHMWIAPEIYKPAINQLDFFMSVGYMEQADKQAEHNITPQPQPIALIALLDYVQVPIQEDKLVFYGLLTPDNSYSYIPANIDVSNYSGKKELLVIQISYPRVPACFLIPSGPGFYFYFPIDVRRHGVDVQN